MLEKLAWLDYAKEIMTEWKQCLEEGKPVGKYEESCRQLAVSFPQNREKAEKLGMEMAVLPVKKDFAYLEPENCADIKAAAEGAKCTGFDEKTLLDKLEGAWTGRIAGCQLGKPVEGMKHKNILRILKETGNYPLNRYIQRKDFSHELVEELKIWKEGYWADNIKDAAFADDDTNYTVLALRLMEKHGRDFTPEHVLEAWLECMPFLSACTAERVAYRNVLSGFTPPQTALSRNPYREWIGAQIRADFYGYCNPGDPEAAAELAYRDACISHTKNGIYGALFAAAMTASAFTAANTEEILAAGLSVVPRKSRLYEAVQSVTVMFQSGASFAELLASIHTRFDEYTEHDWCHTIPNAMIVVAAILYSGGNFGKGICLAVESAFDTDCNGATVGSVLGALCGKKKIPLHWYAPFNDSVYTDIKDNRLVTVESLAKRTAALINSHAKPKSTSIKNSI